MFASPPHCQLYFSLWRAVVQPRDGARLKPFPCIAYPRAIGMFCRLIIAAMASSPSFGLADQSTLPVDREHSYLGVYAANVYVRDQDRSLRFYVDQLGFT